MVELNERRSQCHVPCLFHSLSAKLQQGSIECLGETGGGGYCPSDAKGSRVCRGNTSGMVKAFTGRTCYSRVIAGWGRDRFKVHRAPVCVQGRSFLSKYHWAPRATDQNLRGTLLPDSVVVFFSRGLALQPGPVIWCYQIN